MCQPEKADGASCGSADECDDACCRTGSSPDEDVCSFSGSCRLGIGESCTNDSECPTDGRCTVNGFCTAGCDSDAACGANSLTGGNLCIAGNFNAYTGYFPGFGGVCVPGCNRDNGDADCAPWSTACELNLGHPSWCDPVLP